MSSFSFETVDPLFNTVYLVPEVTSHIIENHPELEGYTATIKETVEDPDYICKDKNFPDKHNYYKKHNDQELEPYGGEMMKVNVARGAGGRISTAFIVARVHPDDIVFYPMSTNDL